MWLRVICNRYAIASTWRAQQRMDISHGRKVVWAGVRPTGTSTSAAILLRMGAAGWRELVAVTLVQQETFLLKHSKKTAQSGCSTVFSILQSQRLTQLSE